MKKYTILDTRKLLGISRTAMQGILDREEIGTVMIGKRVYVTEEQLQKYLHSMESPSVEERRTGMVARVNEQLDAMGEMLLNAREEMLIKALAKAIAKQMA